MVPAIHCLCGLQCVTRWLIFLPGFMSQLYRKQTHWNSAYLLFSSNLSETLGFSSVPVNPNFKILASFAPLQTCLCLPNSSGSCLFLPSALPCFKSCRDLRAGNVRTMLQIFCEAYLLGSYRTALVWLVSLSMYFGVSSTLMTLLNTYLFPELYKSSLSQLHKSTRKQ